MTTPVRRHAPLQPKTPQVPAQPPATEPAPADARAAGWAASPTATGSSPALRPGATDDLVSSAQTAALGLTPSLSKINAVPALKALGDGLATIDVPLKAGPYKMDGISFTVKPGTVAHVSVQVKNGELVSVGKNNPGTKVAIDPPLDGPLWITGEGLQLQGEQAKQKIDLELGGMFDLHFKARSLADMLTSTPNAKPSQIPELLGQMADLSHTTVDAKVTMRSATLDLGGAKVTVDPSTVFSVKGANGAASLKGHVQLDDFGLDQGGVTLRGTGGQADLTANVSRTPDGVAVDTTLSNLSLSVDSLQTSHPSALVPGAMDKLELGKTQIVGGELGFKTRLGMDGLKLTGVHQDAVTMNLRGSGVVNDAELTVKDDKDTAKLALAGSFDGSLSMGPGGVKIDAQVTHAHVDVGDLQEAVGQNKVSIEHARADGDLRIKTDTQAGTLAIDGQASNIDVLIDDLRGGSGKFKTDLGKTAVTGSAQFHVGSDGFKVDGAMKGATEIQSTSYQGSSNGFALGQSTVSGDMRHLAVGTDGVEVRIENAAADLGVTNTKVVMGNTTVRGSGNVKGTGTVVFDAKGFSLQGKSQLALQLDDGRVHSSTVDLDLAKGSTAQLNLTDLVLGSKTKIKLTPGSKLDAVLDGGSLTVGGQKVELAKGGRAQIDVKNVDYSTGGKTDVRGSLKLDAKVKAAGLSLPGFDQPGLKIHPTSADGRVKVAIDDVHLTDDRLTFDHAQVGLDLNVGKYTGVKVPGQAGVGSLQDPVPALTVDQVKASSAAQIAGAPAVAAAPAQPLDALKLLKQGQLTLDVPLSGALHSLGLDLVKFPAGSKLDLALSVADGKVVPGETKASLSGGVKALGVEITGAHVDQNLEVHVDLKVFGKQLSVPLPGVHLPADMNGLAQLATPSGKSKGTSVPSYLDLSHSRLDVTNATFGAGRISLPGGSVNLAEGSKLSFHGTPLAGELVGNVGLDAMDLGLDSLALKGRAGRGDLQVSYRREGAKAVVDAQLSNLALTSDYAVEKDAKGDYFSLGAGKITGGSISIRSDVALTPAGLPRTDVLPKVESGAVSVSNFSGDLKSARVSTTVAGTTGVSELGQSHVDGSLAYTLGKGLSVKATVDQVDAHLDGVQVAQQGRTMELENARLKGQKGRVELGNGRLIFDAQQLAWDVTARSLDDRSPTMHLKAGQTHLTGEGRFSYDSQRDLVVQGKIHLDSGLSGSVDLGGTQHVTVNHATGLVVHQ